MDVGVGLWALRSTAAEPANHAALYADLQDDAVLAEELGLHSVWLSEHHFWYDGWCPSLPVAAAAVLGATSRLHVGTGVMLLPLHDPDRLARAGLTLEALAPGRTHFGVGLGYRDVECDGLGVSRRQRGRRAGAALDVLMDAWAAGGPELLVGGIAEPSLRRGAERGLGFFLPSSMTDNQTRRVLERARAAAPGPLGRIGLLKNAVITDGSARAADQAQALLCARAREYGGSWWRLGDELGFAAPDLLDEQMARNAETAIIGPPEVVAEALRGFEEAGVDLVVLHVHDEGTRPGHREAMQRIAADVLPVIA